MRNKIKFEIPPSNIIPEVNIGDTVKVCCNQERFWTEVLDIKDENIVARVDNQLGQPNLQYNDIVYFKAANVYDVYIGEIS